MVEAPHGVRRGRECPPSRDACRHPHGPKVTGLRGFLYPLPVRPGQFVASKPDDHSDLRLLRQVPPVGTPEPTSGCCFGNGGPVRLRRVRRALGATAAEGAVGPMPYFSRTSPPTRVPFASPCTTAAPSAVHNSSAIPVRDSRLLAKRQNVRTPLYHCRSRSRCPRQSTRLPSHR